jgi:hypothetical protein
LVRGEQDFVRNHKLEQTFAGDGLPGMRDMLEEKGDVEVLLVGDGPQVFSLSQGRLERKGCRCHFAKSQRKLEELLNQKQFDIVLTMPRIEGSSTDWLGAALSGSRATLFYVLPVEVGCWWVPVLRVGAECFGAPALRPREFSEALDGIVDEIRTTATKIAL